MQVRMQMWVVVSTLEGILGFYEQRRTKSHSQGGGSSTRGMCPFLNNERVYVGLRQDMLDCFPSSVSTWTYKSDQQSDQISGAVFVL